VSVTGQSLGAAIAQLSAYYVASAFPDIEVEAIAIASPQIGDAAFFEDFRRKVRGDGGGGGDYGG